jgi:hypothetical protein
MTQVIIAFVFEVKKGCYIFVYLSWHSFTFLFLTTYQVDTVDQPMPVY